ncbi:MAG TPA: hypothetical protein VN918_02495 [Myxococcaceae bacterium]|nr:hypothetical protein [Myxococcaceae bacterium]
MIARILATSAALLALAGIPLSSAAPSVGAADAGIAHPLRNAGERFEGGAARLSDEDREVLENLELLQHLDDWRDLDVLIEISKSS